MLQKVTKATFILEKYFKKLLTLRGRGKSRTLRRGRSRGLQLVTWTELNVTCTVTVCNTQQRVSTLLLKVPR